MNNMFKIEKYKKLGYRGYFTKESGITMDPKYIVGFTEQEVKDKIIQRLQNDIALLKSIVEDLF